MPSAHLEPKSLMDCSPTPHNYCSHASHQPADMISLIPNIILAYILSLALTGATTPSDDLNVLMMFSQRSPLQHWRLTANLSLVSLRWKDIVSSLPIVKRTVGFGSREPSAERFGKSIVAASAESSALSVIVDAKDHEDHEEGLLGNVFRAIGNKTNRVETLDLRLPLFSGWMKSFQSLLRPPSDIDDGSDIPSGRNTSYSLESLRMETTEPFDITPGTSQRLLEGLVRLDIMNFTWDGWDGWAIEDMRVAWGGEIVFWSWITRLFGPALKLSHLRHLELASRSPIARSTLHHKLNLPALTSLRVHLHAWDLKTLLGLVESKVESLDLEIPSPSDDYYRLTTEDLKIIVINCKSVHELTLRGSVWSDSCKVDDVGTLLRGFAPTLASLTLADGSPPLSPMDAWFPALQALNRLELRNSFLSAASVSDIAWMYTRSEATEVSRVTLEVRRCKLGSTEGQSAKEVLEACGARLVWEGNEAL